MEIIQNVLKKNVSFFENLQNLHKDIDQDLDTYFKEIDNFLKTGDNLDYFKQTNTQKENVDPIIIPTTKRRGRQKKTVLADITELSVNIKKEKISDTSSISKNSSKNSDASLKDATEIRKEKDTEEMPAPSKLPPRKKKIKAEAMEVPKRSTRSRAKNINYDESSNKEEVNFKRSSDVIIQDTTITTIDITDSERDTETDNEKNSIHSEQETRSTRSKMRKQNKPDDNVLPKTSKNEVGVDKHEPEKKSKTTRTKTKQKKRTRSNSEENNNSVERKKSKSDSNTEHQCNGSIHSDYEDAVSTVEINEQKSLIVNATFVASKNPTEDNVDNVDNPPVNINSTVVLENPVILTKNTERVQAISPSKDDTQAEKTPPKPKGKTKGNKQIFSPFEKTSLKKKVEAFEKLTESSLPIRVTRTKKKVQEKEDINKEENELKALEDENKFSSKENNKTCTPIMTKFMPKVCSTSKINKLHPNYIYDTSTNNESVLSVKSASALKASQAEFREREKRRQEKEREALKKREALLQAQTEEKRRKREEKQLKAQQQREMLEKEKLKQLEAQKIKEEKYKQAMADREEKLQKQKEEAEKKRLLVKKKANEILKEKEEVIRMEEQKKYVEMKAILEKQNEIGRLAMKQKMERAQQQRQNSLPAYMTSRPPLLPTYDCYDSDDPEFELVKRHDQPSWSRDSQIREMQMVMIKAGEKIKNTFFCRQVQTPDLQEIFELIDPRKLKRTSSAIWRKPPRYTLMPTIEDQPEFSEDSD